MRPIAVCVITLAVSIATSLTVLPAATPDPIQALTIARAGEALDMADRIGRDFWPTMKVDDLALMVIDPGRGVLLFNHPAPGAEFAPQGHVLRHRPPPKDPDAPVPEAWAKDPGWKIDSAGKAAAARYASTVSNLTLAGRRTAVVRVNEVTVPTSSFGGMPPSEAVIAKMTSALFLAHLDEREGEPAAGATAAYTADAEDLSLIALEQRILAWLLRIQYTEKTMAQYRRLAAEWLAVRRTRAARNPRSVAIEEAIERREGLADYTETLPARILDDPGREPREDLEKVDPFFDRYASNLILRLSVINYPLLWTPGSPEEALRRARATGTALAGSIWPMLVRWNQSFYGEAGRKTMRELFEQALKEGKPEILDTDAALLEAAGKREGLDQIRAIMGQAFARKHP